MVVASGGRDREEQGGRRINNFGGANVVILQRLIVEEADANLEYHPTYPINTATQSRKKESQAQKIPAHLTSYKAGGKRFRKGTCKSDIKKPEQTQQ